MHPSHLRNDELEYELRLRKIEIKIDGQKKRRDAEKLLFSEIKKEGYDYKLWPSEPNDTLGVELTICERKVDELEKFLLIEMNASDPQILNQLYSRLCHIETRLARFEVEMVDLLYACYVRVDSKLKAIRSKFFRYRKFYRPKMDEEFLRKLDATRITLFDGSTVMSKTTQKMLEDMNFSNISSDLSEDELLDDSFSESEFHNSTSHNKKKKQSSKVPHTTVVTNKSNSLPVHKWDVKFDGGREDMKVLDFIKRVNFFSKSENMKSVDLFKSAYHLFKGDGQLWFENNFSECNSWKDIESRLKEDFLPKNYKRVLEKQILDRKQRSGESYALFLASMNSLFEKLEKEKDECEKVEILRENLRPIYRDRLGIHLARATKLHDLKQLCLEAENMYPECLEVENRRVRREPVSEVTKNRGGSSGFSCWNCGNSGHLSRDCTSPKTIHCHKCGKKDVTVRTCPECSKNA